MRLRVVGATVIAGMVVVAFGLVSIGQEALPGPRNPSPPKLGEPGLIAISAEAGPQLQQITVISPQREVMAVYHVDTTSGKIALRSVRSIHWDLQMIEFNAQNPTPREIQAVFQSQ